MTTMKERMDMTQQFSDIYITLKEKLNNLDESSYDDCIKYYFEIDQNKIYQIDLIKSLSLIEKQELIKDLIKEAVNMDMCNFISTGKKLYIANKFYQKILNY
jgi:hypothetical protein